MAVVGVGVLAPTEARVSAEIVDWAGDPLRLELQPLASNGANLAIGPRRPICLAPCDERLSLGRYTISAVREDGSELASSLVTLTGDARLLAHVVDNSGVRTGVWIGVGIAVGVGAVLTGVGAVGVAENPYDITGLVLTAVGVPMILLSLSAGFALGFEPDGLEVALAPLAPLASSATP